MFSNLSEGSAGDGATDSVSKAGEEGTTERETTLFAISK